MYDRGLFSSIISERPFGAQAGLFSLLSVSLGVVAVRSWKFSLFN
jgi:hypothetical protein